MFPKHCMYDNTAGELQISGYNCFRSSFSHRACGTCIYVKSKHKARKLDTMNTSFQEAVWCMVYLKQTNSLLVGEYTDLLGVPSPMTLVYYCKLSITSSIYYCKIIGR